MISVIIPTLNEGAHLQGTLERIQTNSTRHEIVVVDGGSTDSTSAIAFQAEAKVVRAPAANRSLQMNLGAQHATGEIFLFLHADTQIRNTSLAQVENALREKKLSAADSPGDSIRTRFSFG